MNPSGPRPVPLVDLQRPGGGKEGAGGGGGVVESHIVCDTLQSSKLLYLGLGLIYCGICVHLDKVVGLVGFVGFVLQGLGFGLELSLVA